MYELIKIENTTIGDSCVPTVNARELHALLEIKSHYKDWFRNRVNKYDFQENIDYCCLAKTLATQTEAGRIGSSSYTDHYISLAMAKELCMVENNEKGREARRYFIKCEKQLLAIDPETKILSKLLKSESNLETTLILKEYKEVVQAPLLEKVAEQQPKADFYDIAVTSSATIDIGEAAKILKYKGAGRNNLFKFLRREGVLMKNNAPKQEYVNKGWFKLVEYKVNGEVKIKTLVYQKGLDGIRKMLNEAGLLPEER